MGALDQRFNLVIKLSSSGGCPMGNAQPKMFCSICDKRVALWEDACVDENGKPVYTDCYAKRILQDNRSVRGTAA